MATALRASAASTPTNGIVSCWKQSRVLALIGKKRRQEKLISISSAKPPLTGLKRGTAKPGTPGWSTAMLKAKGQAERYAKALPVSHGWPPFLLVTDVGYCIEVFADFTGTGKAYAQFPDRASTGS